MKPCFKNIPEAEAAGGRFESAHDFVRSHFDRLVAGRGRRAEREKAQAKIAPVSAYARVFVARGLAALALLLALQLPCAASLFQTNVFINPFTQLPDVTPVKVFTLDPNIPILSNGQMQTHGGFPLTWNQTNGPLWLPVGNYFFTNSVLGSGLFYRVPDSSSNYSAVLASGGNTFLTVYVTNNISVLTNGGFTSFATNSQNSVTATNAPDGNLIASLNQATNAVAGGLNTATNSFDPKGLANTIGANVTNAINALGQNGSNNVTASFLSGSNLTVSAFQSGSNLSYALGQNGSNNVAASFLSGSNLTVSSFQSLGQNGSNNVTASFLSGSNLTVSAFQSGSNLSYALSQNGSNNVTASFLSGSNLTVASFQSGSNLSYALGQNGSNNTAATFASSSNLTFSAATALTNFTMYLAALNGRNTNFLMTAGPGTGNAAGTNIWSGSAYTNVNGLSYWTNGGLAWTNYVSGIAAYQSPYIVGTPITLINGTAPAPVNSFFTNSLAAGANVTLSSALGVTTISSSGSGGGTSSNALTAVVATNAPDGNVISSLQQATNAVSGGLNTATNSFDPKGIAMTVGGNATNAINALGVASTNQSLVIGQNLTNTINAFGAAGTNQSNVIGQNGTNYASNIFTVNSNQVAALSGIVASNGMTSALTLSNDFHVGPKATIGYAWGDFSFAFGAVSSDKFGDFAISSPGSFNLGAGVIGSGNFSGATNIPFTGLSPSAQAAVTNAAYGPLAGYVQTNNVNPVTLTNSANKLGGNGGLVTNVTAIGVSNATVQMNNSVNGLSLTDSSGSSGALNASSWRVIEGPSDVLAPIQLSTSNNTTVFSVAPDGQVTASNIMSGGTITGNLAPATNLPFAGLSPAAQNQVTNAAMAVGANDTNYANSVGSALTNLFNTQGATFANIETNALVGTNPVAVLATNYLSLQGNGNAGANSGAPDFASYYTRISATLFTNAINGMYFTNNGVQWLLNNAAGVTLSTFATIGTGVSGLTAAGTPPGGVTYWAVTRNNNYNGEIMSGTFTGTFNGNGSGLTNISNTSLISSGAVTNFGTAATLTVQNQYGDCWGALQRPPVVFYFAPYPSITLGVPTDNETTITNYLNFLLASGIQGKITNSGYADVFWLDVGWDARRNFNPSFVMTNMGTLMWDTNLFPDGIPWLAQKLATNGIALYLGMYGLAQQRYIIPNTASGFCTGYSTVSPTLYTNGNGSGFIYTNNSFKEVELSTPDTLQADANQMHWWGVAGWVMNDGVEQPDDMVAKQRLIADQNMKFTPLSGFNFVNGDSYFNSRTPGWTGTNGWGIWPDGITKSTSLPYSYMYPKRFLYFPMETVNGIQTLAYGDITRKFNNGTCYDNFASPVDGNGLTNLALAFPSLQYANQGGYIFTPRDQNAVYWAMHSATSGPWLIDGSSTNYIATISQFYLTATTASIALDPLQAIPTLVTNFGSSIGQCYKKPLANGDVALIFWDEGTNNWFPTVSWNQLGFNTNDWYSITRILQYGASSFSLPVTNKTGINGNFQLSSGANCVIRISKVPDAAQLYSTAGPIYPHPNGTNISWSTTP